MTTTENPLQTPVQFVPGCGRVRAELLGRLGIQTVEDLLWYLPREVLDLTHITQPSRLKVGEAQTVRGVVLDRDSRAISGGRTLVKVLLDCGGERVSGAWFNQPWMFHKFREGNVVTFAGKPKRHQGRWEFSNPQVQHLQDEDDETPGEMLVRYGLTEGLRMDQLRRVIRSAIETYVDLVPEHLPASFLTAHKLPTLREALRGIHLPGTMDDYRRGLRRVLFDDLFEFQLGLAMRRRAWQKREAAPVLPTSTKVDSRIRRLFPFRFTQGQDAAVREIIEDLASGRAMHRLLQADVGAGKTAIAMYAMLVAIAAGYQAVLMAPTEVLANQHWATVDAALAHSRVKRVLLTGQLTPARRRRALDDIRAGATQLVVGTQAVIQEGVRFGKLGVAVIDEQHKFGVVQRATFSSDEKLSPHVLVMTATPIPRSLCLTQFGDLDITTIAELPPGRQKIVTSRVTGPKARERAWEFVRKQLRGGRQAYIVCPRVSASGDDSGDNNSEVSMERESTPSPILSTQYSVPSTQHRVPSTEQSTDATSDDSLPASAEEVYEQLREGELKDFRVGLVHGQMDRQAKAAAMEAFREGETQALVSTTVVEVGVDVPNATLMVVNQAERFGLSQLHQLRGRVGRGKFQGYCLLFSDSEADDAASRLTAMERTADGFQIAEADFELRGPGDVLGTRQHGQMPLRVADLKRDRKLLDEARKVAFELVDGGAFDAAEFAPTKIRVLERFGELMELPRTG